MQKIFKKNNSNELIEYGDVFLLVSKNDDNNAIVLNETSKLLLEQLETPKTVDELIKEIIEQYDVTLEQANNDVSSFLNEMLGLSIIVQL